MAYDIAIIVLKDEIVVGKKIKIARLPDEDAPCPKGRKLVASGWGLDMSRFSIRSLDKLWAVSKECLEASSCPIMNQDSDLKTTMLCVGDPNNLLNSACNGDSGGMFYIIISNFSSNKILGSVLVTYVCYLITGPITSTSNDGSTTLYGVVSMLGASQTQEMEFTPCQQNLLMVRVSAPRILNWIQDVISKY